MNAKELIAKAAARGVDLISGAQQQTATEKRRSDTKPGRTVGGFRSTVLIPPPISRAFGSASRTTDKAEWTVAELAQSASEVPRECFLAACYSYAGQRENYWPLQDYLLNEALALKRRFGWPAQVTRYDDSRGYYLEHLAQLVLDEDANQSIFLSSPGLYVVYMGVTMDVWNDQLYERYDRLRYSFTGWISHAMSMMNDRLREEDQ